MQESTAYGFMLTGNWDTQSNFFSTCCWQVEDKDLIIKKIIIYTPWCIAGKLQIRLRLDKSNFLHQSLKVLPLRKWQGTSEWADWRYKKEGVDEWRTDKPFPSSAGYRCNSTVDVHELPKCPKFLANTYYWASADLQEKEMRNSTRKAWCTRIRIIT